MGWREGGRKGREGEGEGRGEISEKRVDGVRRERLWWWWWWWAGEWERVCLL